MADTNSQPVPSTPWAIEADMMAREQGWPLDYARDFVILRWLQEGDTRALAALLASGRAPGPAVLRYVAAMLEPDLDTKGRVSFTLQAKVRPGGQRGRRNNPETDIRDVLLYEHVAKTLKAIGPGGYDSAIRTVAADFGIPRETVRKAYDSRAKLLKLFRVNN